MFDDEHPKSSTKQFKKEMRSGGYSEGLKRPGQDPSKGGAGGTLPGGKGEDKRGQRWGQGGGAVWIDTWITPRIINFMSQRLQLHVARDYILLTLAYAEYLPPSETTLKSSLNPDVIYPA